jgi:hypothetical protein
MHNEFENVECCYCDSATGRPNVPELSLFGVSEFYVCDDCAQSRPGKFEGNANRRLAVALCALSMDTSYLDEEAGNADGEGWAARIGRFLVFNDSAGFFSYAEFEDENGARDEFARIEAENDSATWTIPADGYADGGSPYSVEELGR